MITYHKPQNTLGVTWNQSGRVSFCCCFLHHANVIKMQLLALSARGLGYDADNTVGWIGLSKEKLAHVQLWARSRRAKKQRKF